MPRARRLLRSSIVLALSLFTLPGVDGSAARATTITDQPYWTSLSPPYVAHHRLVHVPTQNAVYQIGGVPPLDVDLPGFPQPASLNDVQGLWVWPLDGGAAFEKGPLGSDFGSLATAPVFFDPLGNRLIEMDASPRLHHVTFALPGWAPLIATGSPPPESGPAALDADSSRALLVTRSGPDPGLVRVFSLSLVPSAEAWSELSTIGAPAAFGNGARAAYDRAGRRLVVVDTEASPPQVWTLALDTRTWEQLFPAVVGSSPGGLTGVALAWDEGDHRLLAYGGVSVFGGEPRPELWQLVLEPAPQWSVVQALPRSNPEGRAFAAIAYDAAGDRLFMNGGKGFEARWTFRNRQLWFHPLGATPDGWGMLSPPSMPRTSEFMAAAADTAARLWYVHGGSSSFGEPARAASDSLWAVSFDDPTRWELLSTGTASPDAHHVAVLDPSRQELWVHGKSLRRFHVGTSTWEDVVATGGGPGPRSNHAAVHDPLRERILFFVPGPDPLVVPMLLEVWSLDPESNPPTWSLVSTQGAPPPLRGGYSAHYDPATDRVLVCGGFLDLADTYDFHGEPSDSAWALDLSAVPPAWERLPDLPGDRLGVGRQWHAAAIDPARHLLIVAFGLAVWYENALLATVVTQTDVWALELDPPQAWIRLEPGIPAPRPRFGAIATFDPRRDRMLITGGRSSKARGQTLNQENGYADDVWALEFDKVVPTALDLIEAVERDGAVHLAWHAPDAAAVHPVVDRRVEDGPWSEHGPTAPDPASPDRWLFVDREVEAGTTYHYRLRWYEDGAERTGGVAEVRMGSGVLAGPASLALAGANPARGRQGWSLALTLPRGGNGLRLEIVDARGRRVWTRLLDELPAGRHTVSVGGPGVASPGLYFGRLHGGDVGDLRSGLRLVRIGS